MDDHHSVRKALLLKEEGGAEPSSLRRPFTPVLVDSAKWVLKVVMWVVFVAWVAIIFLFPANFMDVHFSNFYGATSRSVFGITGSVFLLFSAPVLIIALLGAAYLIISGDGDQVYGKKGKKPRFKVWTFPVMVEGALEVVTAGELIGIMVVVVHVMWALYSYTLRILGSISQFEALPFAQTRCGNSCDCNK